MQNNPNQEIHTGYVPSDVFTPLAANQLARTNHYDFVITQEMLDAYRAAHSGATTIDIGNLIASNADGTDGTWANRVKCPVSIYISAKTSFSNVFQFNGRLTSTSEGGILDCSDYKDSGGNWNFNLTDGMVNVYSEYPYTVDYLPGGFNFWSTPQNIVYVSGGVTTMGKIRIGSYGTKVGGIDLGTNDTIQVICQRLVLGAGFSYTRYAAGGVPSVVYAGWTGGGDTDRYRLDRSDTELFGLYEQVAESLTYGASTSIVEEYNGVDYPHQFSARGATSISFYNGTLGQTITLNSDGSIGRTSTDGGVSGGDIVITDLNSEMNTGYGMITPVMTLFKDGVAVTTKAMVEKLFQLPVAGSPNNGLFIGKNKNIKWVTWSHGVLEGTTPEVNPNTELFLRTEGMAEGLVYELEVIATTCKTAALTSSQMYSPRQEGAPAFKVWFVDGDLNKVNPYRWLSYQHLRDDNSQHIQLTFMADSEVVSTSDSKFEFGQDGVNMSLPILARAKLIFVMLSGNIYVMAY